MDWIKWVLRQVTGNALWDSIKSLVLPSVASVGIALLSWVVGGLGWLRGLTPGHAVLLAVLVYVPLIGLSIFLFRRASGTNLSQPGLTAPPMLPFPPSASGLASLMPGTSRLPHSGKEIFIDQPLEELLQPYRDLIGYQAKKLTEDYLGKWVRIEGPLDDFHSPSAFSGPAVTMTLFERGMFLCTLAFDRSWTVRLSHLPKGQIIRVVGRIEILSQAIVKLVQCRLEP